MSLSSIFSASPFKRIQAHMQLVEDSSEVFLDFIHQALHGNWDEAASLQRKIDDYEGRADALKKEVRLNLPSTLFMPISRGDLLELVIHQDRIINKIKDISGLIVGRRVEFPSQIVNEYNEFVLRSVGAIGQANKVIGELDELLASGFRGHEAKIVKEMILVLEKMEKGTDKLQINIRTSLFEVEEELPPIKVMFLYKVIDWTGVLADRAQIVAHIIQLMLAK